MSFLWPAFLWALLLLPLLLLLFALGARRRERTAASFADPHLLPTLLKRPQRSRNRLLTGLQLAALTLLLLAAARPLAAPPLPVNRAAVVIAFDASRSMLADDVEPTRLDQARAYAERFVAQAPPGTRIGLASFSDIASVLVPPTTDRTTLLEALAGIEPARNTSLAEAVVTGVRMLPGRGHLAPPEALTPPGFTPPVPDDAAEEGEPPPGSILILSDGVTNVSANPELPAEMALELAARFAADHGVRLYAVPVGREGGAVSRIDGQDYFIPFEPRNLERLTDLGEGTFVFPVEDDALSEVFRELGRVIRWEPTELEISSPLSALALIVLLVAGGLGLRWQRRVP
jgi:Ca-activated chloride channel family protein